MARPYIRRQILDPPPPSWVDTLMTRVFDIASTAGVYYPDVIAKMRRENRVPLPIRKKHSKDCPGSCRCHYYRDYGLRHEG